MIMTSENRQNENFPHLSIYCSEVFSKQELESYSIHLEPVNLKKIPKNEGTVYFYHQTEEQQIHLLEKESPECYFSPLYSEEYFDFITTVNKLALKRKILAKLQSNLEELTKNEKRVTHLLKREDQQDDQKVLNQFFEFDSSLFNAVDLEEFLTHVKKAFGKKLKNISIDMIEELEDISEFVWPIFIGKKVFVLSLEFKKIDENEEIFIRSMIYYWVNRFLLLTKECEAGRGGNELWEKIFSTIPLPMALISDNGEILLHNKKFVSMGLLPSECLSMKTGENVQIKEHSYFLDRFDLEDEIQEREGEISLYIFRAINEEGESGESSRIQKISSKELGIISSSIAHELNNPLGGVMAAISLLELDEWSDENKQHLEDMKESAKRCRDLIDIFLGFSKVSKNAFKTCSLEEAVKQSLNMLRFRMIESNLRFDFEFKIDSKINIGVNFSTSTMLFYLILGEVLTSVHHDMLISSSGNNLIKVCYEENIDTATLCFDKPVNYQKNLMDSKLLRYLIDTENLNVEISDSAITISEWKLT